MEGNNSKPMNIKIHQGFWTRDQVARDVDSVYVFGDNFTDFLDVYVPSSTQAVIRGLPNAYGISTKNDRFKYPKSYLSDEDGYVFRSSLEMVILLLKIKSEEGKTIVFPEQGLGTGKAMLKEKAPACWEYLCKRLKKEFNYANGQDE